MVPIKVKEWEVNVKEVIRIVKVFDKEGGVSVRNVFIDWIIVLMVSVDGVGKELWSIDDVCGGVERDEEGIVISI